MASNAIEAAEAHTAKIGSIVHGLASIEGAMAQWRDAARNARLAESIAVRIALRLTYYYTISPPHLHVDLDEGNAA